MAPPSAAALFRARVEDPKGAIVVCPGVYDGFSARIALDVGFDCLYMVCRWLCGSTDLLLTFYPD